MKKSKCPDLPVLLVDDEQAWLHSFSLALRAAGIGRIVTCGDSREVMELLAAQPVGAMVLDLVMPHLTGEEILPRVVEEFPEVPVIIITGLDQVETAVKCMKLGAFDYFTKVTEDSRLVAGVQRALYLGMLQRENDALKEHFLQDKLDHPEAFGRIVTHNKAMRSVFQYMEAIAATSEPVLITGETGVGKELVAQALHALSGRKGAFVPVNAAGLDDTMFADSLFGHRKGAFTGAETARQGLIEQAAAGTIFLDEIGDLSQISQVKLLRLLQEREYFPVGSDIPKRTDARMVFATHRDLDQLRQAGDFRKDLFYRLRAHHIHIPPLRERPDDLQLLFEHFLEEAAGRLGKKPPHYPKELLLLLGTYDFPGNVRELRNLVFDALSKHKAKILGMETFKSYIRQNVPGHDEEVKTAMAADATPFAVLDRLPTMKEAGYLLVLEALQRAGGNQAIAAGMLGITRQALNWRLKQAEREIAD